MSEMRTEMRALDEPLSDAELDELEVFLASDAVPQDCMDLEMLDGFLTAIVSGPESIQPSEWLPQVWSDGGRTATAASVSTLPSRTANLCNPRTATIVRAADVTDSGGCASSPRRNAARKSATSPSPTSANEARPHADRNSA